MVYVSCRFSFETYAKIMKQKATKCSLKTTEVVLDVDGTCAYLSLIFIKVSCFKSHTNSWCHNFFQKKVLSNFRSEIHLDQRNIVFTGQSVRASKNIYSGSPLVIFLVSTPRCAMEITLNDNTSSQKVFFFFFFFQLPLYREK